MSESKIIPGAGPDACERWELPPVADEPRARGDRDPPAPVPLTASQLEALQKEAYDEAFREGYRAGSERGRDDGRAAMEAETRPLRECFEAGLSYLAAPLAALEEEVEQALVTLAMAVARQLVRRELRADPGQVVAVVREGLSALPAAVRNVRVYLHPEDVRLAQKALTFPDAHVPWVLSADPLINRGGCRIESESSRIDATVEARLASVIAHVMGGEREEDAVGDTAER